MRTRAVCAFLLEVTERPQIYNVDAGIFGWIDAGFAVVDMIDYDNH